MSTVPSVVPSETPTRLNSPIHDEEKTLPKPDVAAVEAQHPTSEAFHDVPRGFRRAAILALLCSAQFFDIFNACASVAALPSVRPL